MLLLAKKGNPFAGLVNVYEESALSFSTTHLCKEMNPINHPSKIIIFLFLYSFICSLVSFKVPYSSLIWMTLPLLLSSVTPFYPDASTSIYPSHSWYNLPLLKLQDYFSSVGRLELDDHHNLKSSRP